MKQVIQRTAKLQRLVFCIAVAATIAGLSACATTSPQPTAEQQERERDAAERKAQLAAKEAEVKACYSDGYKTFKGTALDGPFFRFDENGKALPPTLEITTSTHRLTQAEKKSFSEFDQLMTRCGNLRLEYTRAFYPDYVPAVRDLLNRAAASRAKLYAGERTLGEYFTAARENQQAYQLAADQVRAEQEKTNAAFRDAVGTMLPQNALRPAPIVAPTPTYTPRQPTDCTTTYYNTLNRAQTTCN